MAKNGDDLSEAVLQARNWANELVRREARGPGDTSNAMHRLEARYGIPWRTFWQLRYRAPKDVFVGVYQRLGAAYQAECERQRWLLEHELEITKLIAGPHAAAVVAAGTVVGAQAEQAK